MCAKIGRLEFEGLALLMEDRHPEDIGRQKIAGELDSPEGAAQRPCETVRERVLPTPADVLDQQMPAGEKGDHGQLDHGRLALDDPLDIAPEGLNLRCAAHRQSSLAEPFSGRQFFPLRQTGRIAPMKIGLTWEPVETIMVTTSRPEKRIQ